MFPCSEALFSIATKYKQKQLCFFDISVMSETFYSSLQRFAPKWLKLITKQNTDFNHLICQQIT